MLFKDIPIQKKLMRVTLLIGGVILFVTCTSFFAYEFYSFRQTTLHKLSTLGEVISTNSTAALAFDNRADAYEILAALKAEPHIVAAGLYDKKGNLFTQYPANAPADYFPAKPGKNGYHFEHSSLEGFQPVIQGSMQLGTLYLKSDLQAMYERFQLYAIIVALVIIVSLLLTYLLSRVLGQAVSKPIVALAETAKAVSVRRDYSVRAIKLGRDELGLLTDAFNQMLIQIEKQNEELSEFNQNLEQKVSERTHELEVANKEMESFSYSVSHDLRAPLRAIDGYMNVFSEEYGSQFTPEAKRLITLILNNSKKMGQLIDDLLAFSKLGRKELTKTDISMEDIVFVVSEELKGIEENRNMEFILKELPSAYADKTTLKQVWVNLISNAIKYTRSKEKAVIEIGAEVKEGVIIYYIKDNGAGFDMKYAGKLFGVFQRLHSEEEFEGTGVGLAIVQRIIEKHGGKIWADAKINEGATFYFTLPKNNG